VDHRQSRTGLFTVTDHKVCSMRAAFTLVELIVVVTVLAILAVIAVPNFLLAKRQANIASCAANLHAIAIALQSYKVDLNKYPLADGIAGESESMGQTAIGMGPAGNGSWDGAPRVLVRFGYLTNQRYLFCPEYYQKFKGDRQQKFRYAYNNSAADTGGTLGGANDVDKDSSDVWL